MSNVKYMLGNALRELADRYEAESDRAAWEHGRQIFLKRVPCYGYSTKPVTKRPDEECARVVYLTKYVEGVLPATPGAQSGDGLSFTRSFTVMVGLTNEPWPSDWPDNLS